MSVRCPACGFESADGSKWCDFCKEPFRVKKPETALGPLDDKGIVEALRKDWASQPVFTFSPAVRTAAIGLLVGILVCGLLLSILLLSGSRPYSGPGADIPLGKPQVISIPKKG